MGAVHFFTEEVNFQLEDKSKIANWVERIISLHGLELGNLNFIFCSDDFLHRINLKYLKHDTLTDVISFDQSDRDGVIEGDIYISLERIKDNCKLHDVSLHNELYRVMAHGLLHLIGFSDKTKSDKIEMQKKEQACLSLLDK